MIKVPEKLVPYIDFEENIVIARDLPPELKKEFENFKKFYESLKNQDDFSDY